MNTQLKPLIEIVTLRAVGENNYFFRRQDTHQTIAIRDNRIIAPFSKNYLINQDQRQKGLLYLPQKATPAGANSILYLTSILNENSFLYSIHFANTIFRPDDDIRTAAEGEIRSPCDLPGIIFSLYSN